MQYTSTQPTSQSMRWSPRSRARCVTSSGPALPGNSAKTRNRSVLVCVPSHGRNHTLRKRWKELGLGLATLLLVSLAVAGTQPLIHKYLPSALGPLAVVAIVLLVYLGSGR